jgi:hypothetical protein
MNPIARALADGYTAFSIVDSIVNRYPRYKRAVNDARKLGYSDESILKQLSYDDENGHDPTLTEHERVIKRDKNQKRKAAMQAVGALGTAGAVASGSYGYATRNRAVSPSEILTAQKVVPEISSRKSLQRPSTRQIAHQTKEIPYSPRGSQPQQPPPTTPRSPITPETPRTIKPSEYESSVNLVKNLKEENRVSTIVSNNYDPETTAMILRKVLPKNVVSTMEKVPGGLEKISSDYALYMRENQPPDVRESQKAPSIKETAQSPAIQEGIQESSIISKTQPQEMGEPRKMQAIGGAFQGKLEGIIEPGIQKTIEKQEKISGKILSKEKAKEVIRKELIKKMSSPSKETRAADKIKNDEIRELQSLFSRDELEKIYKQSYPEITDNQLRLILSKHNEKVSPEYINKIPEVAESIVQKPEEKTPGIQINKEIKNLSKNIVITPQGTGEVYHKGKEGIITKINEKKKAFYQKDVDKPSEDLIEAVQNILNIPEIDRSSNIALFIYNPRDKEMYFQFHSGDAYKYYDVDPGKVYRLANKMNIPITEGKNVYGAWSQEDRASLGATFYQEIKKDPKYAKPKKGEPPNPYYEKLETMYDYWEKLRKKPKEK